MKTWNILKNGRSYSVEHRGRTAEQALSIWKDHWQSLGHKLLESDEYRAIPEISTCLDNYGTRRGG